MSAKSDVFDVPRVAFRVPWSRHSPAPARAREAERDAWPAEERTTARGFAIPALEDEVYEDGEDGEGAESLPVHRAPRSSSPDLPIAAQLLLKKDVFAEASVDLPLGEALGEELAETAGDALGDAFGDLEGAPSAEVNARIAQMLAADAAIDASLDARDHESDAEIEVQIELEADAAEPDRDALDELPHRYDDDPDVLCSNGFAHATSSSEDGADAYQELQQEAGDRSDETDEDASWWMRVDASALDQLPLPQELELDDLPDAHSPGVISGTAGGPTLQQRLLTALDAPTEIECSCGHDCDQREHALRELFRELTAAESRTLHLRLSLARHEDQLALAFAALPRQHRARLLDFLDQHARRRVLEGASWRVIRKP